MGTISFPFAPVREAIFCWVASAVSVALVAGVWSLYVLPPLGIPLALTHKFFYQVCRESPITRIFPMVLTVRATIAVTRREWTPSPWSMALVFVPLLLLMLLGFSRIKGVVIQQLPFLFPSTAAKIEFFVETHQLVDFCSNMLWALAAPMIIHLENNNRALARALLRTPPMRALCALSKYSYSFYCWQFPALQLLQLQVSVLLTGAAECIQSMPNSPYYSIAALPDNSGLLLFFSGISQNLLLAVLSTYLLEEPANALLKRAAERALVPGVGLM